MATGCFVRTSGTRHVQHRNIIEMSTDEEKTKLAKLLEGLEVVEVRLSERCSDLVKNFHQKFDKQVEEEEEEMVANDEMYDNPYKPDAYLLEENEKKLKELWLENRRYVKIDFNKI